MNFLSFMTLVSAVCAISGADVPQIKLNTGHNMPVIGLGTWQTTGPRQAVKDALEIGYRHIDTANIYGNEGFVGDGLHDQIKAGVVKREDVFITTKIWPDANQAVALERVQKSLKAMNLTYIDLVLVHAHGTHSSETYKGLEDAYNQKLVRSIGISQYNRQNIDELLKTAKVKPAVNQIEIHPNRNEDDTVSYCKQLGIAVTGFSPLAHGKLINDATLTAIGKKHNKTASQVAIRWQLERGLIVIPKSSHKEYIKENFEVFDFKLTEDEMKTIHAMH